MQTLVKKGVQNKPKTFWKLFKNQLAKSQQTSTTAFASVESRPEVKVKNEVMDGNSVAAYVAYGFSENSFIYPISPSSAMGDKMDQMAADGKTNIFGEVVDCLQMQSEAGAAGAMHGAVASGALTSTFTASQGLLLMIPNLFLMAGERAPTVIHVASRTVAKHALSIFNDHSDVMACRQTGFALLCSSRVQEVHDLGIVAHLATVRTGIPFLHFFDGWQTSHTYNNVELMEYSELRKLFPDEYLKKNLRDKQMTTINPLSRGTGERPDIFFQHNIANKKFYDDAPELIQSVMEDVAKVTGRDLGLFKYYGHPEATEAIVLMGSGANSCRECLDYFQREQPDRKVGVLKVQLYRPWSPKHFLEQLPTSVKKITVLDKTREEGSQGEPLYLDVLTTLSESQSHNHIKVYSGVYGLASKNFTPPMIVTIFNNMLRENPRHKFTIGINDDVTHTSLDVEDLGQCTLPPTIKQCINWGFGGDGSVGAMNSTVKLIAEQTGQQVQLQTSYDSKKEGGATVSHLRYGSDKITAEYLISQNADMITCTKEPFIRKFDMVSALKKGGIFLQNTTCTTAEEIEQQFPAKMLRQLAEKEAQFYIVNATAVAQKSGMAKRTNTVMQASFLKLSGVLPGDESIDLLRNDIKKRFRLKGEEIINKNLTMLQNTMENLIRVEYDVEKWKNLKDRDQSLSQKDEAPAFVKDIMNPVLALKGDDLPVSSFNAGGLFPQNTARYEKRGIALEVPIWKASNCTQCNYCSLVCPHSVIRPFLLTRGEKKEAPEGYETIKATGGTEVAGFEYSIQVSSADCTGCAICVESCPDDALEMRPSKEVFSQGTRNWEYSLNIPVREDIINPFTIKGSQFLKPYFEFSGACSGCGETPYMKLVSQLFGRRMIIANASGCSSVWGGTATTSPWVVDEDNRGPAWARSLFEDNAEYGLGMFKANKQRKKKLAKVFRRVVNDTNNTYPEEFTGALRSWLDNQQSVDVSDKTYDTVVSYLEGDLKGLIGTNPDITEIDLDKKSIVKESQWLIGGDGWAYDIGFGGLDHVMAKGENVNVLIFDTEMYSNTGGQASKATELSTSIKFSILGKRDLKKDLGVMAMTYGNVYVASVAMGANYNQTLQAIKEAEEYPGTSIILALSPCIDWGFGDMKYAQDMMKDAVESGYWTLYRYDPRKEKPLTLDSKKIRKDLMSYLGRQQRFEKLVRLDKTLALNLHEHLQDILGQKHQTLLRKSMDDMELLEYLKKQYGEQLTGEKAQLILYGSETGTAENLAVSFADDLKSRGVKVKCMAMDDYDIDELPEEQMVHIIVSTCGDGQLPQNCQYFTKELLQSDADLSNVKFTVFGLGDSSYTEYNESAKILDKRFSELGAQRILDLGLGNDKDDEKYETAWYEWFPQLEQINELPAQPDVVPEPKFAVNIVKGTAPKAYDTFLPQGTKQIDMNVNTLLSPEGYDRDVRHYEFDIKNKGFYYGSGDCLSIFPKNDKEQVSRFLDDISLNPNDVLQISRADKQKLTDLPQEMTVHQIFTEVLDVFGRPSRRFYEFLQKYTQDESEKSQLRHILSKEGTQEMKDLISETTTYADLFRKFPSAVPNIEYMIQHVAPIKPRLYSIASHPELVGDEIHLCIIADDWKTPSGKHQEGLCSNYLRKLEPATEDGRITARLYPSSITIHPDQTPPIFMIALGTGIAPMRALVQERKAAKLRGEPIGPMTLLFGSRHQKGDWLYEDEWKQYQEEGILTNVITAFSRDQKEKIYVQHRVDENPDLIHDYLYKNNGYFYLCGIGGPEEAVKTSVRQAVQQGAGLSDSDADSFMVRLAKEGRFNFETW